MDIQRRGMMLVLSSPSGAGKSTLSRWLLSKDDMISMSVSATTRSPRPGETDGEDYYFKSEAEFKDMIADQAFLEHAKVFDNYYGTPKAPVEAALQAGRDVMFDIDWQGAQQLPKDDLVKVFILPPSKQALYERLKTRAQDSDEVVQKRMAKANGEITHWNEYDYIIVNDDLDKAKAELLSILNAERLKRERRTGLFNFVQGITGEE